MYEEKRGTEGVSHFRADNPFLSEPHMCEILPLIRDHSQKALFLIFTIAMNLW